MMTPEQTGRWTAVYAAIVAEMTIRAIDEKFIDGDDSVSLPLKDVQDICEFARGIAGNTILAHP